MHNAACLFSLDNASNYSGGPVVKEGEMAGLVGILWTIAVILIILWVLGLVFNIAGGLIHILLVIAIIVIAYNLITSRRAA